MSRHSARASKKKVFLSALVLFAAAMAGTLAPPAGAETPTFRVGYMPIFPSAPEFVKSAKGW